MKPARRFAPARIKRAAAKRELWRLQAQLLRDEQAAEAMRLAAHPVEKIVAIYLNDELVGNLDAAELRTAARAYGALP